jgi:hypothetical protein
MKHTSESFQMIFLELQSLFSKKPFPEIWQQRQLLKETHAPDSKYLQMED